MNQSCNSSSVNTFTLWIALVLMCICALKFQFMLLSSNRKYMLCRKLNSYFFMLRKWFPIISNDSFHHVSDRYAFLSIQHSPQANGFLVVTYGSSMLLLFRKKSFIICGFLKITSKRPQYCDWDSALYCVFAEFCQKGPGSSTCRLSKSQHLLSCFTSLIWLGNWKGMTHKVLLLLF